MNAKRKILIAVIAGAVVLAGGAFAWKTGKGRRSPAPPASPPAGDRGRSS